MDTLIDARAQPPPSVTRKNIQDVEASISKAYDEVPRIPLFQPFLNVATQKSISG